MCMCVFDIGPLVVGHLRRFMLRFSACTIFRGVIRPLALFIIYFYYIILLFPKQ